MAADNDDPQTPTKAQRYLLIGWMAGVLAALLVAILIAASIEEGETRKALLDKILDWPVLAFAILMMLFGALGREVLELVRTRNIKVGSFLEIGERIREVKDEVGAVEAVTDDITGGLEARVTALETAIFRSGETVSLRGLGLLEGLHTIAPSAPDDPGASEPKDRVQADPITDPAGDIALFDRLVAAIRDSRFEWRSLERLAVETGLSEEEVRRLFRDYGEGKVRMSLGKARPGQPRPRIATLVR
tara:strand:+ start:546 stop:1283 length:738 start_codon:yes stop_codon:yes gene_type:complete